MVFQCIRVGPKVPWPEVIGVASHGVGDNFAPGEAVKGDARPGAVPTYAPELNEASQ